MKNKSRNTRNILTKKNDKKAKIDEIKKLESQLWKMSKELFANFIFY